MRTGCITGGPCGAALSDPTGMPVRFFPAINVEIETSFPVRQFSTKSASSRIESAAMLSTCS